MIKLHEWKELSDGEICHDVVQMFDITDAELDAYDVVAGVLSGDGWSESCVLILRERTSGEMFVVNASHCSCFGFEDQFDPDPFTLEALASVKYGLLKELWTAGEVEIRAAFGGAKGELR